METLFSSENLVSFLVLVVLEVVLGIDNVIFVSIIMNRLPAYLQPRARLTWMITGIISRSILLFGLSWLLAQKGKPLFSAFDKNFDLASLVMLAGGLFLLFMACRMLRAALHPEPAVSADGTYNERPIACFVSTFILTATNPITIVAFLGIFAFFGIGAFGLSNAMALWLVLGVFVGSSVWWLSLAGLAGAFRQRLGNGGLKWINGASGLLMLGFGLYGIGSFLLR